ncbi:diphthine synthase [Candidatus Micrarchaeota archaeon]|nr:diphthine synthase [Candidatus Micrarchaeota archaeon]
MLYLIGFGINGSRGLTLEGVDTIKKCDIVFIEKYTSIVDWGKLKNDIKELTGKDAKFVNRGYVEDGKDIIKLAGDNNVCILISGDPMIATTHLSLVMQLKSKSKIIHSNSILSVAISESGLHMYKFGQSVTLSRWYENYKPLTTYDVITENLSQGLHTLILMDIIHETGEGLDAGEGIRILRMMENERMKKVITDDTKLIVMSRLGYDDQKITYGKIKELEHSNLGRPPFVLIYPGKLHFTEEDALERFEI